jgi:hypothetical protein
MQTVHFIRYLIEHIADTREPSVQRKISETQLQLPKIRKYPESVDKVFLKPAAAEWTLRVVEFEDIDILE